MEICKYPDGSSYVKIPSTWEETTQNITFKINSYEDIWHLNQLCEVLRYNKVIANITIPNLLDAQADKRFNEYHSTSLTLISNVFNEYENISLRIFNPHNPEVVEAIFDRVEIMDNREFINEVLNNILEYYSPQNQTYVNNLILMSSDAGGFKPLMKLCDKINWKGETFSASKGRDYQNGKTILTQTIGNVDFNGKDILIVDDISVYGGTFKGLSKLLKDRNCGKLYLAVSHLTVQNLGEDPATNYYDKVFTTNSKYDTYNWGVNGGMGMPLNLEIIKLF